MEWISIGKALLVFWLVFFTDALWTIYIQAASKNKALTASTASMILVLIGGINIWLFVHSPWLLIPEMLGGFAGTWVIIKRNIKKEELARPAEQPSN